MNLIRVAIGFVALETLAHDVRLARNRAQRGDPVIVAHQFVGDRAGLDMSGPANEARHAEGAFPVGVLLGAEWRHRAVRPGVHVRAVVAAVDDDRVIGDAHVIEGFEKRADRVIVLDHAVDVLAVAVRVAAAVLGADVRAQVHAGGVHPAEERLVRGMLALHVVDGGGGGLVVDSLHPLLGESASVFDGLFANFAEARIDGRVVHVGGFALEHAARAELGSVSRVLRIVGQLGFFLGVEVIEIAEELVEAVDGRQSLVAIADVVLAELSRSVSEVLKQAADRRIELAHPHRRAREAHLGQPRANAVLSGEERGATGCAGLFAVVMKKANAFLRDAIDVGRFVSHQPITVRADVADADVVAPDDEDIRFFGLLLLRIDDIRYGG